jgi:hypothetical protein
MLRHEFISVFELQNYMAISTLYLSYELSSCPSNLPFL